MPSGHSMANEAAYLDFSAILRIHYRVPGPLPMAREVVLTSSEIVRIELALELQRRQLNREIDSAQADVLRKDIERTLGSVHLFPVSDEVVQRASEPFGISVGLRTALHVATAEVIRPEVSKLTFWTWVDADAAAATVRGLEVGGVEPRA